MTVDEYVDRINVSFDDGRLQALKEARDIVRGSNSIGWALHWLDKKIESFPIDK